MPPRRREDHSGEEEVASSPSSFSGGSSGEQDSLQSLHSNNSQESLEVWTGRVRAAKSSAYMDRSIQCSLLLILIRINQSMRNQRPPNFQRRMMQRQESISMEDQIHLQGSIGCGLGPFSMGKTEIRGRREPCEMASHKPKLLVKRRSRD